MDPSISGRLADSATGALSVALALALALLASALPQAATAQWLGLELTGPSAAEQLGDPDADARARAAHTLGRYGERTHAVTALIDALARERDVAVRREILLALARRGDVAALEPRPASEGAEAAPDGQVGQTNVVVLVEALAPGQSPDPAAVAHALGAFDSDTAIRALIGALDRSEIVDVVIASLAKHGPRAVPHLVLALSNEDQSAAAARALGEIGDSRAVPTLTSRLGIDRVATRLSALAALGQIGDERATHAVAQLLGDDEPAVVRAAVRTLGEIGASGEAARIEALLAQDWVELRRSALTALARIDPARVVPLLEAHAAAGDPTLGAFSIDLALTIRHPAAAALLHGLLREGSRANEAASALAELSFGAGIRVLLHTAKTSRDHDDAVTRELAVAVRKWGAEVDPTLVRETHAVLASRARTPRMLLLRAIARDEAARPALERALGAEDADTRALAALGLEVLGDPDARAALVAALEEEGDDEGFRRIASALFHLGGRYPPRRLVARFGDDEVAPEAMLLAAIGLAEEPRSTRTRVRTALRRGLHSGEPRVRVGAAFALAVAHDSSAFRALAVALDDREPEVRHAAARALAALGDARATPWLEARGRIEEDSVVAQALADALTIDRRLPPEGLVGLEVLRVRIRATAGRARGSVPVDVVLPDGRYARYRTLSSGELIVVDLPLGTADVRARVEARSTAR